MVWVMIFAFYSTTNIHIEYGPIFSTQDECLRAQDFQDNRGTAFRTFCLPMEGQ